MIDNPALITTPPAPGRLTKWAKVIAAICPGIVIAAIIGLIVFQQPVVIVKAISSTNQLRAIRGTLIGVGIAAFVLMLVALVIAFSDAATHKRIRYMVIGFIGLPVLNAVLLYVSVAISVANPCSGFGECYGRGLAMLVFLGFINICILIFASIKKRWWILLGMAAALVTSGCVYYWLENTR